MSIKNKSYRHSISHAWFQQHIPGRGVHVTGYKFLKFAFIIVQIWFVFPQLSKKYTLNVWLQTSGLQIHFPNLQIDKHVYQNPIIQKKERKLSNKKKKVKRVPKLLPHRFQPLYLKYFASFALQIEQKWHKS